MAEEGVEQQLRPAPTLLARSPAPVPVLLLQEVSAPPLSPLTPLTALSTEAAPPGSGVALFECVCLRECGATKLPVGPVGPVPRLAALALPREAGPEPTEPTKPVDVFMFNEPRVPGPAGVVLPERMPIPIPGNVNSPQLAESRAL